MCPHCFDRKYIFKLVEGKREKVDCHCVVRKHNKEAQKKLVISKQEKTN